MIYLLIIKNIDNHQYQIDLVKKLKFKESFLEEKFIISELKSEISSYKQQDIKKDLHESENLILFDDVVNKLFDSKLICYYCNEQIYILFNKVRYSKQWTLDRLNNLNEHTCNNTIIACLKCNLQRRRKNSDKFKFTKQLENNIIKINKIS